MEKIKKRTFELMFNTYNAFPENNAFNWIIVLIETIQMTFYPLRRTFRPYWNPIQLFDASNYVIYSINPALIVGEIWGPYLFLFFTLVSVTCLIIAFIIIGQCSDFFRRKCTPFLVILKILMKLYATVMFIPCFSLYGNVFRCISDSDRLYWKVFPELTCFSGFHTFLTITGVVGAIFHILIAYLYYSTFWDSTINTNNMFTKQACNVDMYKLLMWILISMLVILIDISLNILFAIGFVSLVSFHIYLSLSTFTYYNILTKKIIMISNYLPVLSGGILLSSIILFNKIKVDAIFVLLVGVPFIVSIAMTSNTQNENVDTNILTEFTNYTQSIKMLHLIQHWSLYKINASHAHEFSLSGFIFQHLKSCRDQNCSLLNGIIATRAFDLYENKCNDKLANIASYFINDVYLLLQIKFPNEIEIKIPYYIFLYEMQRKYCQVLFEITKAKDSELNFNHAYLLYKIKRKIKDDMKDHRNDKSLFQTKVASISFSFQKHIKACAESYMELWENLLSQRRDIKEIKQSYEGILNCKQKIKTQWKQYSGIIGKVERVVAYFVHFTRNVEGNIRKAKKLIQRANEKKEVEAEIEGENTLKDDGTGFMRVSADLGDYGTILDCNYAFCKMFGTSKDTILRSKINRIIPKFLLKKHNKAMVNAIGDVSQGMNKKDKYSIGVHTSGYIIPLRISVWKQISFSENTQFYAKFMEIQYDNPTLHIVINNDNIIECASSEIIAWFDLDVTTIANSKINIEKLIPVLKDINFSDIMGKGKYIKVALNNQKKPQNVSAIDLNERVKLGPKNSINEYILEITAEQINYKDQKEGYIICLKIPSGPFEDFEPVMTNENICFNFNSQWHCFYRSKMDRFKLLRGDMARSFFFKDLHCGDMSAKDLKSVHNIVSGSIEEAIIEETTMYKIIAMITLREALEKIPADTYEDDYIDLNEMLSKIKAIKFYGKGINEKFMPDVTPCKDEVARAITNIARCYEEESGLVNRVNKAKEIDKKFKRTKIDKVLLSNKETRKVISDTSSSAGLLVFTIIAMIIFVGAPFTLTVMAYYNSYKAYNTVWTITQYIAYNSKFVHESTETINTILWISLISEGRMKNFGNLKRDEYMQMLVSRIKSNEERLSKILFQVNSAERILFMDKEFEFIKGYKGNSLWFSAFGNSSNNYFTVSNIEVREVFTSMVAKYNSLQLSSVLSNSTIFQFFMTNMDVLINQYASETGNVTAILLQMITDVLESNSVQFGIAWSIIFIGCALFCIIDVYREKRLNNMLSLFLTFNSDDIEIYYSKTNRFLQGLFSLNLELAPQEEKEDIKKKQLAKDSLSHKESKKSKRYKARTSYLEIIIFNITLILPYCVLLAVIYAMSQSWFSSFKNLRSEYILVNNFAGLFERACLYSSLTYTKDNQDYASKTSDISTLIRKNMQEINQEHLNQRDTYSSNENNIFYKITQKSLKDYKISVNSSSSSASIANTTSSVVGSGWINEGLFPFVSYGLQILNERVGTYRRSDTNESSYGTDSGKKNVGKFDNDDFSEYYFVAAFLVKPSIEYLADVLMQFIMGKSNDWVLIFNWLIFALAIYLTLYLVFMLSYVLYQRNYYNCYSTFYVVIPKELRKQNEALRSHVKQLINVYD